MNSRPHSPFYQKNPSFFIGLLLLFSSLYASAQDELFSLKLKFSVEKGGVENALITITRDGKAYRTIDPSKGKYFIDLELGSDYVFTFSKPGHITKQIIINTIVPNGREKEEFAKFTADVELEAQPEDKVVTYSQPVGRIKYNGVSGDFDFDKDYTQTAVEAQKKDKQNAKAKPKELPPKPVPKTDPVVVKEPEYTPEPPKPNPVLTLPVVDDKPIVKNKEEKIIQKDRLKITITIVKINDLSYEYKKEEYSWGGVYYYRDGIHITEPTYDKETE